MRAWEWKYLSSRSSAAGAAARCSGYLQEAALESQDFALSSGSEARTGTVALRAQTDELTAKVIKNKKLRLVLREGFKN